jgi:hypothetical protein
VVLLTPLLNSLAIICSDDDAQPTGFRFMSGHPRTLQHEPCRWWGQP